jgi:hypothetical protein
VGLCDTDTFTIDLSSSTKDMLREVFGFSSIGFGGFDTEKNLN